MKHPKLRLLILLGGLLVVLCAILAIQYLWHLPLFPITISTPGLTEIVKLTGVGFPPDTALLNSYMEQSTDTFLIAKLKIKNDQATNFKKGLHRVGEISLEDSMPNVFSGRDDAPAWWNPTTVHGAKSIRILNSIGKYCDTYILISAEDLEYSIIYFYWMRP